MIADFFKYGLTNITKRKLRSLLTLIGIFIGIAAVVALVSLGQGLQKYIDDEFAKLGRDLIIIQPEGQFGGVAEAGGAYFTQSDFEAITKTKGVVDASPMNFKSIKMEFNNQVRYYFLIGIPAGREGRVLRDFLSNYEIVQGRELKDGDKKKVVLGHYFLDRNLFEKNVKLGDTVKINDVEFEVVGFFGIIGNPSDDTQVYMAQDQLKELMNVSDDQIQAIYAKSDSSEDPLFVSDRIEKSLRRSRDVKEGNEDFTVQSSEELMKTFKEIFNIVQVVVIGIAGISLFVGGIGIMNTMFTSVLQRTQEIGIMKSVGARNSDILLIFVIESGILGLVGGAIGIAVGMGIAKLVEIIATVALQSNLLQAYFPWYLIVGSLAFSFIVGAVSGLVPAYQASKLKPVDALRYE